MNKQNNTTTNKPLFDNLRKLINLIDCFRDVGLHQCIELPRIAVLGTQSSGKSSLLENIVGLDFLPRGSGIVTRRPLQLRMVHLSNRKNSNYSAVSKPYGIFVQINKQKKYYDFDQIRKVIESQTDRVAGNNKGVVDHPIRLAIFSYECPDLTLIDLPGITKISVGQQFDVEKVTTDMAQRYCAEERTIILCVIPANADMSTSQGLDLARKWDPQGVRTLGVITKIDIMDRGTDATKMITNNEIPLRYGYIGIRNRSQQDINNKIKVSIALNKQEQYFKNHPIYKNINSKYLGTRSLTKKLTEILQKNINKHLTNILKQINNKSKQCQDIIKALGVPLAKDGKQKIFLIWKLISQFTDKYKSSIHGMSNENQEKIDKCVKLSTGSIIKCMFEQLYEEQWKNYHKIASDLTDNIIQNAIKIHEGNSIPGFPSIHAFVFLLSPYLEKLKQPSLNLLNNILSQLRKLCTDIICEIAKKTPVIMDQMILLTDQHLGKLKNKTEEIVLANVDSQIHYIFTNDQEYLNKRTKLIPRATDKEQMSNNKEKQPENKANMNKQQQQQLDQANMDTKEYREKLKRQAEKLFVKQMRLRVQHYYRLIIKTLREIIPKNIGYFLVRQSQQTIQYSLYNQLLMNQTIVESLTQSPEITQQRQTAQKTLDILKKAKRIIKNQLNFN